MAYVLAPVFKLVLVGVVQAGIVITIAVLGGALGFPIAFENVVEHNLEKTSDQHQDSVDQRQTSVKPDEREAFLHTKRHTSTEATMLVWRCKHAHHEDGQQPKHINSCDDGCKDAEDGVCNLQRSHCAEALSALNGTDLGCWLLPTLSLLVSPASLNVLKQDAAWRPPSTDEKKRSASMFRPGLASILGHFSSTHPRQSRGRK